MLRWVLVECVDGLADVSVSVVAVAVAEVAKDDGSSLMRCKCFS